jgi:hypothetical protein
MEMRDDPHESAARSPAFRKDDTDEAFLVALNSALAGCTLPTPAPTVDARQLPLVYIVGAPRSGTTLLSQLASRFLPLGYIDNVIARFWQRPSAGIRLSRILLGEAARTEITFESKHGVTTGCAGPHEFGYFWRHWLPLDDAPNHHLPPERLARVDSAGLKSALEDEILSAFGTGAVFKNVICGFHAAFLSGLHPASLFVHVVRDDYDTAASILRSRAERYGSYDRWWSLKPSTYPFSEVAGDPAGEVVRQVLDCRKEIAESLTRPGVSSMTLRYADLCADPGVALERICAALSPLGSNIRPTNDELPKLRAGGSPTLPAPVARAVRTHLEAAARPMLP